MQKILILASLVFTAPLHSAPYPLTYPLMPKGVINPLVTQNNIHRTVCVPGYSKRIRPPSSYTNPIKYSKLLPGYTMIEGEGDHVIPIAIGGAPKDPDNIVFQPWDGPCGAHVKDTEEWQWHEDLCDGKVALKRARAHFSHWQCP